MNKDNLNAVKLALIAALGAIAEDNGVEFTEEQYTYMDNLVESLIVTNNTIPEGLNPNEYVISKIKEMLSFLDILWERHERLLSLED